MTYIFPITKKSGYFTGAVAQISAESGFLLLLGILNAEKVEKEGQNCARPEKFWAKFYN